MKIKTLVIVSLALLSIGSGSALGQGKKTIVLVRHTEKDVSPAADKANPELSTEGRDRAQNLMSIVKKYKPHEIFSSDFKRTRQTVEPIANYRKKQIQIYDPAKPAELVEKIMASKTDHYLIVGHSNTIPGLANLLTKKELFRNLLESEYGVIWVVRIKQGAVTKVEIFTY